MMHYCTREHRYTPWLEIQPSTHYGYCYGCRRLRYWL